MPDPIKRAERRKQHTAEIEASQDGLRQSIAETQRLVGESDEMLRRHRKECEEDDAGIIDPAVRSYLSTSQRGKS